MIALEVRLNGKRVCVAGAEDLGVLSAFVTACGKLGKKTIPYRPNETAADFFYSVCGLTSRKNSEKNVHVRWKSTSPLKIGDVIEVKVLETQMVDRAKSKFKAKKISLAKSNL